VEAAADADKADREQVDWDGDCIGHVKTITPLDDGCLKLGRYNTISLPDSRPIMPVYVIKNDRSFSGTMAKVSRAGSTCSQPPTARRRYNKSRNAR
jgi:hypothetical protein